MESPSAGALTIFAGVLLNRAGGALLLWASLLFVFYGYCEDSCDKPERTVGGAIGESLPSAIGAVALMATASYLFLSAGRAHRAKTATARPRSSSR
jgi:hypothetical protein